MYQNFFGIAENPFSITPDPRYLYMSGGHEEALAHLLYGVSEGGGFVLLTGEVGTGKTSICRCLLEQLPDTASVALILNPRLDEIELMASICDELGVAYPEGTRSLKVLVDRLNHHLLELHAAGRHAVVIIDEAQDLSPQVLEQVRLLTNLETATRKLLQVILIGQPELNTMLRRDELRQVVQRITARYHLQPLGRADTQAYVQHRLSVGGLAPNLFSRRAIGAIYRQANGVPRLINALCDRCLLGAYAQSRRSVDARLVRQAAREVFGHAGAQRWSAPVALAWVGVAAAVAGLLLILDPAEIGLLPQAESWRTALRDIVRGASETGPPTASERAASEQPETRPADVAPEAATAPDAPDPLEAPEVAEVPEVAEAPEAPEAPDQMEAPKVAEVEEAPEAPEQMEAPKVAEVEAVTEAPDQVETPEVAEIAVSAPVEELADTPAASASAEPALARNGAVLPEGAEARVVADDEHGETAGPAPAGGAAGTEPPPLQPGATNETLAEPYPEPANDVALAVPEQRESEPSTEAAAAVTAEPDTVPAGRETPVALVAPGSGAEAALPPAGTTATGTGETEAAAPPQLVATSVTSLSASEPLAAVEAAAQPVQPPDVVDEPETAEKETVRGALDGSTFQAAADPDLEQALTLDDLFARPSLATDRDSALGVLFSLWGLGDERPGGPADCTNSADLGVKCLAEKTRWNTLIGFNRPVLITLADTQGRRARVVLAALQDDQATLMVGTHRIVADIAAVRARWSGEYLMLWRPPPIYSGLLALGARGREVDWLKGRLAELDGEPRTEERDAIFDAALHERVMAFQKSRGLKPDGMVGVRTLIHLNTAAKSAGVPLLRRPAS